MAPQSLLILLAYICFGILAYTAAPNIVLNPPSEALDLPPTNVSTLQNPALLNGSVTFKVPGSQISLAFSGFAKLISQTELDLCVIEGIGSLFGTVLARGRDGFLPMNFVDYKYGNIVINIQDFSAPSFRMTYAKVVPTLRGIALFASLYGYHEMAFEVFDSKSGRIGTGDLGQIIPEE